jgi:glucose-6-phosphate 1-dehydrogenase
VLNATRAEAAVRGQYAAGTLDGRRVPGYREEEDVAPDSPTPSFAAMRCLIDNWRWQGVPFLLRSGKRLARQVTEIVVQFHSPPHLMFPLEPDECIAPNVLVFGVQPNEGLSLCFEVKVPGSGMRIRSARMEFAYADAFGATQHDAYETLLLDCMAGESMLFLRNDSTEAAWRVVDPIIQGWEKERPASFPNYAAGSWGPADADRLIAESGAAWRNT